MSSVGAGSLRAAVLAAGVVFLLHCAPVTIYGAKEAAVDYVESGRYMADIDRIAERAERYLEKNAPRYDNVAIVLDIDETSLSNWEYEVESDFGYQRELFSSWVKEGRAPAIMPTLELYRRARELGVDVVFITGRRQVECEATARNLREEGFDEWVGLHCKPDDSRQGNAEYKTALRRGVVDEGYTILINVGDQETDLEGGFAERSFLLPNPFYKVK